jgi:hypothetical protein
MIRVADLLAFRGRCSHREPRVCCDCRTAGMPMPAKSSSTPPTVSRWSAPTAFSMNHPAGSCNSVPSLRAEHVGRRRNGRSGWLLGHGDVLGRSFAQVFIWAGGRDEARGVAPRLAARRRRCRDLTVVRRQAATAVFRAARSGERCRSAAPGFDHGLHRGGLVCGGRVSTPDRGARR